MIIGGIQGIFQKIISITEQKTARILDHGRILAREKKKEKEEKSERKEE